MRVEIDDVDEVLTRTVQEQGRITGLGPFTGKKVKVLVLSSRGPAPKPALGKKPRNVRED